MKAPVHADGLIRCSWPKDDPLYVSYHDNEWGVPEYDDRALYEKLILDGFQAGLSWITILRKRDNFRRAFDGFVPEKIARYRPAKIEKLMGDAGIVRNRAKIAAAIGNAQAFLRVRADFTSFDEYVWQFVGGKPVVRRRRSQSDVPAVTPLAEKLSTDLRERGFKFVGPTIVYSFMQAVGLANDHLTRCFRFAELSEAGK
jgi:DNA-3-methyladenine glycosylase I